MLSIIKNENRDIFDAVLRISLNILIVSNRTLTKFSATFKITAWNIHELRDKHIIFFNFIIIIVKLEILL